MSSFINGELTQVNDKFLLLIKVNQVDPKQNYTGPFLKKIKIE